MENTVVDNFANEFKDFDYKVVEEKKSGQKNEQNSDKKRTISPARLSRIETDPSLRGSDSKTGDEAPRSPDKDEIAMATQHRGFVEKQLNDGKVFAVWEVTQVKTRVASGCMYAFTVQTDDKKTIT